MKDVMQELPLDGTAPSRKIMRMALDAALSTEDLLQALLVVSQMQRQNCKVTVHFVHTTH